MQKLFKMRNFKFEKRVLVLMALSLSLLTVPGCCPGPGPTPCFQRDLIETFLITEVGEEQISFLNQEIELNTCDQKGKPCRLEISGASSGLFIQECRFIYPMVKPTVSGEWFVQYPPATIHADGSWKATIQLGEEGHPPLGEDFLLVGVAIADTLEFRTLLDLNRELPTDYKLSNNIVSIKIR